MFVSLGKIIVLGAVRPKLVHQPQGQGLADECLQQAGQVGEKDFAGIIVFIGFMFGGKLGVVFQFAIRSDLDMGQP
jgi:hypothetical protein